MEKKFTQEDMDRMFEFGLRIGTQVGKRIAENDDDINPYELCSIFANVKAKMDHYNNESEDYDIIDNLKTNKKERN